MELEGQRPKQAVGAAVTRAVIWLRLRFLKHEHGQDLVEYAMLMFLVAVVAMLAMSVLGGTIRDTLYNRFVLKFNLL